MVCRIARIYPANVRADWGRIAVRVHLLVGEVVVSLRVGAKLGIVFFGREYERRAAAPAPHQLGGDQLLLFRGLAMLAKEVAKLPHMLLEPPIGHVAAVARENFGLRAIGNDAIFVRVAKDELARLQRVAGAGRGLLARPLDDRLRETVPIAKMLMGVAERRNGVKVEHGEDLDAGAACDKFPMLRGAPVVLRLVPLKRMTIACRSGLARPPTQWSGVFKPVSPSTSARAAMPCLNSSGKRRERSLVQSKRAKPIPGERRRHPALVAIDAGAHRRRGMVASLIAAAQARPPAPSRNDRNS